MLFRRRRQVNAYLNVFVWLVRRGLKLASTRLVRLILDQECLAWTLSFRRCGLRIADEIILGMFTVMIRWTLEQHCRWSLEWIWFISKMFAISARIKRFDADKVLPQSGKEARRSRGLRWKFTESSPEIIDWVEFPHNRCVSSSAVLWHCLVGVFQFPL